MDHQEEVLLLQENGNPEKRDMYVWECTIATVWSDDDGIRYWVTITSPPTAQAPMSLDP